MQIRFWGTRGSIATPGPDTVRYGGNTSCVEVRTSAGTVVLLDCGTGARALGKHLVDTTLPGAIGNVLVSHTHWDHIQGFPFFAPVRANREEWHVYGPSKLGMGVEAAFAGQMRYDYFPVTLDQLGSHVRFHDLLEGEFELNDIRVTAQYLNHPAVTLGYRLEADGVVIVYATDHEPHLRELAAGGEAPAGSQDDKHVQFLADADLVIHDAQYTIDEYPERTGWGHSTIEYAVDSSLSAKARRLALFHHDPSRDDDGVDELVARSVARAQSKGKNLEVLAAAEGLSIELERPHTSIAPRASAARQAENESSPAATLVIAMPDSSSKQIIRDAIEATGLLLFEARDRVELLALIEEHVPALVIVDARLPGIDPIAFCRDLASGEQTPPAVMVVAAQQAVDAEAGVEAGFAEWLAEPFSTAYARSRIQGWVMRAMHRWMRAPPAANESQRLEALHALQILDTPAEARFDRFTRIASRLFNVPIALVSLVDKERQWFKSRVGLDAVQTHRDLALCSHAILDTQALIVSDARNDDRFADNPLVTGAPHVRFYAGAPLILSGGEIVGTLCLIDRQPRTLDSEDTQVLHDLACLVVDELERGV